MDRAESVKAALVQYGIAAERISTRGHGSDMPEDRGSSEEALAKNRRVEIELVD